MRHEGRVRAYDGFVKVDRVTVVDGGGTTSEWDIIVSRESVAVLAQLQSGGFVLFRQYRVGPDCELDELPGGYLDDGEEPIDGARRELREETGVVGGDAYYLGSEWWAANSSRRKHLVLVVGAEDPGSTEWDELERGSVRIVSPVELLDHVIGGDLTDAGLCARGLLAIVARPGVDPAMTELAAQFAARLSGGGPV